jgi:hypothetical protein
MNRFALAALACAMIVTPLGASAQSMMGPGMVMGTMRHAELGTIQSVQGSSLTLGDGRTVFLHQGTVINPTGVQLAPGMRIAVRGDRDGYKRFSAGVVDVAGTPGYRATRRRIEAAHSMFMGGQGY